MKTIYFCILLYLRLTHLKRLNYEIKQCIYLHAGMREGEA